MGWSSMMHVGSLPAALARLGTFRLALVLALAAPAAGRALAQAERVLLLPVGGNASAKARDEVSAVLAETLRAQGLEVAAHRDATLKHPAARECTSIDCAGDVLAMVGVDLAVGGAVWEREGGRVVFVTLRDRNAGRYPGEASAQGELAPAARAALLHALSLRLLGPGPWIEVVGTPQGAQLEIDGTPVGTLPYRGAIASGEHELRIRADGHSPRLQNVQIPLKSSSLVTVNVTLEPGSEAAPALDPQLAAASGIASTSPQVPLRDAPTAVTPSPWNYVLGGALLATGLLLATEPFLTAVREGECVGPRDPLARCGERIRFGTQSAFGLVGGGVLMLAGTGFFVLRPLHVRVSPDRAEALLHLAL